MLKGREEIHVEKFRTTKMFKSIACKILLTVAAGASIVSCVEIANNDADVGNELLMLEKEAIKREFQNDTTFLSSIMDSTFIELNGDEIKNKHDVLRTIFASNIENQRQGIMLDSFRLEDPVVHIYENSAVVTFIMHTFRKQQDSVFDRRTRFYDVWVRRGDQWKAVTWQASPVN